MTQDWYEIEQRPARHEEFNAELKAFFSDFDHWVVQGFNVVTIHHGKRNGNRIPVREASG